MKKTLVIFFVALGLVYATSAYASSTSILDTMMQALKTAFSGFEGDFKRVIDIIKGVWDNTVGDDIKVWLQKIVDYIKAEWRYRKSIFGDEWSKEKVELLRDIKDLWDRVF